MNPLPEGKLRYRLLTGPHTAAFCERISTALDEGYMLYGSPSITAGPDGMVAAQAILWPGDASDA